MRSGMRYFFELKVEKNGELTNPGSYYYNFKCNKQ